MRRALRGSDPPAQPADVAVHRHPGGGGGGQRISGAGDPAVRHLYPAVYVYRAAAGGGGVRRAYRGFAGEPVAGPRSLRLPADKPLWPGEYALVLRYRLGGRPVHPDSLLLLRALEAPYAVSAQGGGRRRDVTSELRASRPIPSRRPVMARRREKEELHVQKAAQQHGLSSNQGAHRRHAQRKLSQRPAVRPGAGDQLHARAGGFSPPAEGGSAAAGPQCGLFYPECGPDGHLSALSGAGMRGAVCAGQGLRKACGEAYGPDAPSLRRAGGGPAGRGQLSLYRAGRGLSPDLPGAAGQQAPSWPL